MSFLDNIWIRRTFQLRELVAFVLAIVVFVSSSFGAAELVVVSEIQDNIAPIQHHQPALDFLAMPRVLELEFENTTSRRIEDIEVVISGVKRAVAVAANSSRLSNSQIKDGIELLAVGDQRVLLSGLTTLAPRETVQVRVWGDFSPPLFASTTEVSGGFESKEIRGKAALSRVRLYVATNLGVVLMFVGAILLLIGLRRFR